MTRWGSQPGEGGPFFNNFIVEFRSKPSNLIKIGRKRVRHLCKKFLNVTILMRLQWNPIQNGTNLVTNRSKLTPFGIKNGPFRHQNDRFWVDFDTKLPKPDTKWIYFYKKIIKNYQNYEIFIPNDTQIRLNRIHYPI